MAADGWTPPEAAEAPPLMVAFLYQIGRDLLPLGYLEHVVANVTSPARIDAMANPELREWAERNARILSFDPKTGVGG